MTFDKKLYWSNRNSGKRGQGEVPKIPQNSIVPDTATVGFTNDGQLIIKNRAFRRKNTKIAPKSSQLRKKGKRK